jgi:hypothetical protein
VITPILVIDTSYLLEVFQVPAHSSTKTGKSIKSKWQRAIGAGARFFVPLPVVFELANHIAGIRDGARRKALAQALNKAVKSSKDTASPWTIIPADKPLEELSALCSAFEEDYAPQAIGLTDVCIIEEAKRLRKKYPASAYKVHIWTTDLSLKSHEPDGE